MKNTVDTADAEQTAHFIEGYLSGRAAREGLPVYGYPRNHLPIPKVESLEMTTSFLEAFDARKKSEHS
jgi:hypothetical protein